ncbi:signal peptide containing protein [Babesia ovata]|uniref:Signal peptide containing protein n=1 Tax=Babesia ovata TaxID=189622 RepID=A0A2H6KHF5_9APIC|nr:signal peptide containing protein [Babesia ovata]GBE62422.1 signal peptide containing protein [Babesia ovata]
MRSFCLLILAIFISGVAAFRAGNRRTGVANAPLTPKREQLSLFKSDKGCIFERISDSLNYISDTVNNRIPGGVATVITVPVVTAAAAIAIQSYLGPDKSKAIKPTLNRYQCSGCGFTIFPAKNREERFFSSVSNIVHHAQRAELHMPKLRRTKT